MCRWSEEGLSNWAEERRGESEGVLHGALPPNPQTRPHPSGTTLSDPCFNEPSLFPCGRHQSEEYQSAFPRLSGASCTTKLGKSEAREGERKSGLDPSLTVHPLYAHCTPTKHPRCDPCKPPLCPCVPSRCPI